MAAELQRQLKPEQIKNAILSVPFGIQSCLNSEQIPKQSQKFQFFEGAKNNIPDETALKAAKLIEYTIENMDENELLIVLISGGGSALLPYPTLPLKLEEKVEVALAKAKKQAKSKANIEFIEIEKELMTNEV